MSKHNIVLKPVWKLYALVFLRILTGTMMMYHGWEIFDAKAMSEYPAWDPVKNLPYPVVMAYLAKGTELLTGFLLAIGLLTRLAAVGMALIMFVICFMIGNGAFWYGDQHPFLFGLLALVFAILGPIAFSMDQIIFKSDKR